jgi:hypothetical protein
VWDEDFRGARKEKGMRIAIAISSLFLMQKRHHLIERIRRANAMILAHACKKRFQTLILFQTNKAKARSSSYHDRRSSKQVQRIHDQRAAATEAACDRSSAVHNRMG